jgi:hypothetical protein
MAKTKTSPARPAETPPPAAETTAPGDRPVREWRLGRVKCSAWRNESDKGPWFSVKLTRLYRTDDGWKASPSLGRDDLLPAAKLCEEAALWVFRQQQSNPTPDGTPPPEAGDDIPF